MGAAKAIVLPMLDDAPASRALRLYAGAECLIALSALAVPLLLAWCQGLLADSFGGVAWGSSGFYWASGACTALALLPWCACMGATFPLAMAAIKKRFQAQSANSFSSLYLANIVGAGAGTLVSAFILIEVFGFRGTLHLGAGLNIAIAAVALAASFQSSMNAVRVESEAAPAPPRADAGARSDALPLLFMTGLVSMAMEVVWIRQFTPYLGNSVYAFASVLAVYLLASFAGSCLYRAFLGRNAAQYDGAWMFAGALSLLPLYAADPFLPLNVHLRIALGLVPLCGLLGFLTPSLVDRWSEGDPGRAGAAYAVNILGCILGPLIAGFLLLPWMGERGALGVLAAPLFLAGLLAARRQRGGALTLGRIGSVPLYGGATGLAVLMGLFSSSFEDAVRLRYENARFTRDYQAAVGVGGTGAPPVGQQRRHHPSHAHHQDHGPSASRLFASVAEERPGDLFRDGHDFPLARLLGHPDDGGRAGPERARLLRLLSRRREPGHGRPSGPRGDR